MATAPGWDEDEWELCNDDGFVYKRKKRRLLHDASSAFAPPPPHAPDPEAEERHRRERKKKALMKLKAQYQKEIDHWEYLSNTLRAMEERTRQRAQQELEREEEEQQQQQHQPSSSSSVSASGSNLTSELGYGSLVDEPLLQAEAQESIIRDASHLCDVAEAICNAQEECLKKSFIDLPIWASPRELMASLCNE